MSTEASPSKSDVSIGHDDQAIIEAGYQPQLQRSLGFFAAFAVPFSVISITTGIFANYGFVLEKAGPFGFWTWLIVAFGQILVALVLAEMAGRIPLTGSIYNWNNKLASPSVGWMTGWLSIVNFSLGVAATTTTMIPVLGFILGHDIGPAMGTYIAAGIIILQLIINLYGVRLTSHTNALAVIAEIVSIIVLSILIIIAVAKSGHFDVHLLTTIPAEPKPYWSGFLMSSLLGAWTLIGFESSADVSEETINAKRITPKGMLSALITSIFIGFAFIIIMTLAIPDLSEVSKAPSPLAAIAVHYLGNNVTNIFLVFALIAMFSCSMICMTAGSRVVFAMARDGRFVGSSWLSKVSTHGVPKIALFLVAVIGVGCIFMADSATSLYGASTVCVALYYLTTVICFGLKVKKLPKTDTFSLGCWHWPVVILAVIWLGVEIGILTIPEEFHSVALATGGILVTGLILQVGLLIYRRTCQKSKAL